MTQHSASKCALRYGTLQDGSTQTTQGNMDSKWLLFHTVKSTKSKSAHLKNPVKKPHQCNEGRTGSGDLSARF